LLNAYSGNHLRWTVERKWRSLLTLVRVPRGGEENELHLSSQESRSQMLYHCHQEKGFPISPKQAVTTHVSEIHQGL